GGFHLAAVGRVASTSRGIIGAVNFEDVPMIIFHDAGAGYEIGVTQAHLAAGREAMVALGRLLTKIVLFDVEHTRKRNFARAGSGVFGVIDSLELLDLGVGVIVDDYSEGTQNSHHAGRALIEVLAHKMLEHR